MRRRLLIAIVLVACVLALLLPSQVGAAAKIRAVWMEYDARYNTFWQTIERDFEAAHPDVDVETVILPWNEGHDRLVTWIAGNQAPDLALVATRWILEFGDTGVVEPLDTLFPKEFLDAFIAPALEARVKGRLYGLPVALSARALYYRTDLIRTPPGTWQELVTAARQAHKPPAVYGLGLSGKKYAELTEFVYYLYGNGGDFFTVNPDGGYGKCRVNDAAGVEALQMMVDLVHTHQVTEPDVAQHNRDSLQDLFLAGKLAMIATGPWFAGMIQERAKDLKWAVAPMPRNQGKPQQTLLVTDSIMVLKTSQQKDAVVKFLQFLYLDRYRLAFNKDFGMLPVRKSVAKDAYFQRPTVRPFIDQLPGAKPWPLMAEWSKAEDILWNAVTAALLRTRTPKQALDDACRQIDRARGIR
jgi:multiple sugar transport system substrate-binding protein